MGASAAQEVEKAPQQADAQFSPSGQGETLSQDPTKPKTVEPHIPILWWMKEDDPANAIEQMRRDLDQLPPTTDGLKQYQARRQEELNKRTQTNELKLKKLQRRITLTKAQEGSHDLPAHWSLWDWFKGFSHN